MACVEEEAGSMIDRDETEAPVPYPAGTPVPRSAKYAGLHEGHYLPYQMMHLFGGEPFPRCPQCGDAVTYVEVLRSRRRERPATAVRSAAHPRAL
jgi:hypothetical protein